MEAWIRRLFEDPAMCKMGHGQNLADLNLGLGWVYYGLARSLRPKTAVVIGSYRGFVPLVLGKAMQDNGGGEVVFIDPSMVDEFWTRPDCVSEHFESHGVHNIHHHQLTTQEFVKTNVYEGLLDIELLFVDGLHTAEQARYDHEAFLPRLAVNGITLFHDSVRERTSRIYGADRPYDHTVYRYMDQLRANPRFDVFSMPEGDGLTLVRQRVER